MLARTPKDLGLLIRDRRHALQLDQKQLAQQVGVSRQWIVEVEAGKARAEVGLVLSTLAALGLDLDVRAREPGPASPPAVDTVGVAQIPPPAVAEVDLDAVLARAKKPKP